MRLSCFNFLLVTVNTELWFVPEGRWWREGEMMIEEEKLMCFQNSALVEVCALPPEGWLEDADDVCLSSCLFYPRWLRLLHLFCFSCPGEGVHSWKAK